MVMTDEEEVMTLITFRVARMTSCLTGLVRLNLTRLRGCVFLLRITAESACARFVPELFWRASLRGRTPRLLSRDVLISF